ncbi:MAG: hypothetical protein M3545_17080, partial [Acidobacteriota bacterium]|nr:hypothetical protein [Acidobacteriota bacterium]
MMHGRGIKTANASRNVAGSNFRCVVPSASAAASPRRCSGRSIRPAANTRNTGDYGHVVTGEPVSRMKASSIAFIEIGQELGDPGFNAARVKNVSFRSRAGIQRSATWTATSTLLCRGASPAAPGRSPSRNAAPSPHTFADRRLIPARINHASPQLIGHDHRRDAAKVLHSARVTLDEIDAALGEGDGAPRVHR